MIVKILIILIFVIISVLYFYKPNGIFRRIALVLWISLAIIAALRPETMADYDNYVSAVELSESYDATRFEPAFKLINYICNSNYLLVFFLFSFLAIGIKIAWLYKLSPILMGSMLVYVSNLYVLHEMIQIRAGVAAAFLLVLIPYLYNRDFKHFLFITLVAMTFHYSAITFLFLWFVNPRSKQRIVYLSALIISYALSMYGFTITNIVSYVPFEPIQLLYQSYSLKFDEYVNIFNILQIGRCLLCVVFWYYVDCVQKHCQYFNILIKIYTIGLCALPLFSDLVVMSVRLNQLFITVEMALVPVGFYYMFRQKHVSCLLTLTFSLLLLYMTMSNEEYWKPL